VDYGKRTGVEGMISQGVRACGMRGSRYAGQAKTHLQHLATAAAVNVLRIGDWLAEKPREDTRISAFARCSHSQGATCAI
jgi:transposase